MTFMRKSRYIVILAAVVSVLTLTIACMDADHKDMLGTSKTGAHASHVPQPTDTLYTRQIAMSIYAYQPLRALQIIDSAVIVGNVGEVQAEQCRARIVIK